MSRTRIDLQRLQQTPRRVLGYARVSSTEQALGTSLGDQQEAIKAYARSRGLNVARMFVEAESAVHDKFERREQIQLLMREVREGDLVLCDKIDRWSRDPEFTWRSVREIGEAGARSYFVSERCDPSTPEGDTMLNFRIAFAREEHKRIKERLVGTRNLLRSRGYYVEGRPPYGYRRPEHKTSRLERNVLEIVPEEAKHVRAMFRMVLSGKSLQQICDALGLGKKRVWSSLHCRSYIGDVRTADGWVKGLHEAIVDAATYTQANAILRERRHGGPRPRTAPARTDTWILRDVAHCADCGSRVSAAYGNDKEVDHYYVCRGRCQVTGNRATRGSFVRVRDMDEQFEPMVVERLKELREEIAKGDEPSAPRIVDFESRRKKLLARRDRHLEQHAAGLINTDRLRSDLNKVDEQLLKLDADEASQPKRLDAETRRAMLREIATIEKAWRQASAQMKRQLVGLLTERVDIKARSVPVPTWRAKEVIAKVVR